MVKKVEIESTVACTARQYFKIIYDTPSVIKDYHLKINNDDSVVVGSWSGGKRDVEFKMPVKVPDMLKKIIGVDIISVIEHQKMTWNSQNQFKLTSEPTLQFAGAAKFATTGEVTVTDTPGGCKVLCVITCNATMPWPLKSTVEEVMGKEANETIQTFIIFARDQISKYLSSVEAVAPIAVAGRGGVSVSFADEGDAYFDIEDTVSLSSFRMLDEASSQALQPRLIGAATGEFEKLLQGLVSNIGGLTAQLSTLNERLDKMNADLNSVVCPKPSVLLPVTLAALASSALTGYFIIRYSYHNQSSSSRH
uniref:VASt domain-containing protein n=1 Tax=Polytomella parva TaxID=51329 RepID=A0A7S0UVY7_9CHLO|mmetsp:Transcript_20084/g.36100  ORF Transcript_20084/g.36100 Transcript_20084/m.36100 type:complete len:308 (+) Transcript_20084:46-969(+)